METGSNGDISITKARLEMALAENPQPIQLDLNENILTLTLRKPDFRIYLSFARNNQEALNDWKQLAKDFELPWDIKPVDKFRLQNIFARLEAEGWTEYRPIHQVGFTILNEMENFKGITVFTIPSMGG